MSKFVKDLITNDLRNRLKGVDDALLVDVIGLKNDKNIALRQRLRKKNIQLLVVKNSLARRATEGTRLERAFDSAQGTMALVWGGEDIISLAKEVIKITEEKGYESVTAKGGVMDGQPLAADQVKAVSKWPSRKEQLSILSGQILSVGATLSGQLLACGSKLASQIKKKSEEEGGEKAAE
ncbi:MAG TPA: 50S ribosomal protein L10 [Lacipirellulaceae bacterium]|jgi:large subunit ribosomal protein L10|nr:50S ribosomal protein L10 [Lacipirellulaceae bacterium]